MATRDPHYSCYCAICGGPFPRENLNWNTDWNGHGQHDADNEEDSIDGGDSDDEYDSDENDQSSFTVTGEQDFDQAIKKKYGSMSRYPAASQFSWLGQVRYLGDDPASPWPGDVWSCEGNWDESDIPASITTAVQYFLNEKGRSWVAIFHGACREIFCQQMGINVTDLNRGSLWHTFRHYAQHMSIGRCLDFDYGDIEPSMRPLWSYRRGPEHSGAFDPVQVRGLDQLYQKLLCRPPGQIESKVHGYYNTKGDPFVGLPPEILYKLLAQLKLPDVTNMRQASPAIARLAFGTSFWKDRVSIDMPWLWDLPMDLSTTTCDVDWKRLYLTLYRGTRYDAPRNFKIHGLCNRRRIWEQTCPLLIKTYQMYESRRTSRGYAIAEILHRRTIAAHSVQVMMPSIESFTVTDWEEHLESCIYTHRKQGLTQVMETFVDSFSDIPKAKISLRIDWSKQGYLLAISVLRDAEADPSSNRPQLQHENLARTDIVPIPSDNWFTGFLFTSREVNAGIRPSSIIERQVVGLSVLFGHDEPFEMGESQGDKMYIRPRDDSFVVGLRMDYFSDGQICRVDLIQQPADKAYQFPRTRHPSLVNWPSWASYNLWHNGLPALDKLEGPRVVISNFRVPFALENLHPHQLLLFGPSEAEMSDITSIAVDDDVGGLEITYGHRETRTIGPWLKEMKRLEIDGLNGERVVSITSTGLLHKHLLFATNWGRYLSSSNEEYVKVQQRNLETRPPVFGLKAQWVGKTLEGVWLL